MATSTHASLSANGPLRGDAGVSIAQSSRLADYIVFSALWLLVGVQLWRRLKDEMFGSYRPERHYMRGPGPKYREKGGQDHR